MRRLAGLLVAGAVGVAAAAPACEAWTVQFRPYEAYATSSWPETVKIADVTGDGRNDVLLTTSFYFDEANDYKLFVFAQLPDGSFAAPKRYAVSGGVGTGDLDGDGDTDVAVGAGQGMMILEQAGGTLSDPRLLVSSPTGGDTEIADMNGDGRNDIVVSGDRLHVLTNEGAGAFRYSTIGTSAIGDIETTDANADGLLDVVGLGGGGVTEYLHASDGTYAVRAYGLAQGASGMGAGDFTGDGRIDFAFSAGGNSPDSKMVVIPQTPDGGLSSSAQVYTSYDIPEPVDGHDLNGDGLADVVTLHGGWNAAGYYLQGSGGTLQAEQLVGIPYASHYNLKGLDVGDIDCDGRPDVALADYNSGLVIVRQTAPATKPASCPPPEPVPRGGATPPPPADPPPAGAVALQGSGAGGGSSSATGAAGGAAYGGVARDRRGRLRAAVALVRRADGRLTGRVGLGYACGSRRFPNLIVRLAGLPDGSRFTASGSVRLTRRARLRVALSGALAPDAATGTMRTRVTHLGRCHGGSRTIVLRPEAAPSGAPAKPAGGALLLGVTAQSVAGVRLPISLQVARKGTTVRALWEARMHCGPRAALSLVNVSPSIAIRGDGTFSRRERFSVRYRDGSVDRYVVTLKGAFVADGVTGTFRARMQTHAPGRRYLPCDSATQHWTARP